MEHRRHRRRSSPRCCVVQRAPDLARYRWSFLLVGVGLLLLPLVPGLGFGVGGARIWVSLGPINFQPGEFAKLALAIFFAGYLAENRELIADEHVEGRPVPPARAAPPRCRSCWRGASPSS